MRKEKLITRTITVTTGEFMCIDVLTANVEIITSNLIGKLDIDTALKTCKSITETDTYKVVACQSIKHTNQLYGMTENEFISHAKVLPPRKTLVNEENESAEV